LSPSSPGKRSPTAVQAVYTASLGLAQWAQPARTAFGWKCPDGTKVQIADGDQYTVFPGSSMTYIRALCQKDRHKISELQCTPGSPGALSLFCPDNQILIYVIVPPKA
ncbi:hypothetical protein E4U43_004968, partial [Claviceps pusilla]